MFESTTNDEFRRYYRLRMQIHALTQQILHLEKLHPDISKDSKAFMKYEANELRRKADELDEFSNEYL